jgi:hypothetical protein
MKAYFQMSKLLITITCVILTLTTAALARDRAVMPRELIGGWCLEEPQGSDPEFELYRRAELQGNCKTNWLHINSDSYVDQGSNRGPIASCKIAIIRRVAQHYTVTSQCAMNVDGLRWQEKKTMHIHEGILIVEVIEIRTEPEKDD